MSTVSSQLCAESGCAGTMLDGYCDTCGMAAGTPADASGSISQLSPDTVGHNPLTSSTQGAAASLGSRRIGADSGRARRTTGSTRLRTSRLGAGVTVVPPAALVQADQALLTDPARPEAKRFCSSCGKPVGRAREGQPGRTRGFCPHCRTPFAFTPPLSPGDLVAGQYDVAGAIAHGGLGWIYLARDRNVSGRWVVLKGLIATGNADSIEAAIAEQRFLAQVSHPNIVKIYNFVNHDDAGYIVMEYVGGHSLKDILKNRMSSADHFDPLPVDQALAYLLEVLPAFGYLHDLGLAFCDFKPDNVIQTGDEVKLIDLGGVRRIHGDTESAIFGTIGYQAPEVARLGVSVESDIYTIGRTLAMLTIEFRGYQGTYRDTLPAQHEHDVFTRYESFYRLVRKTCAPDRSDRFGSVDELRTQALGVLREVVAQDHGAAITTSTARSLLFEAPSADIESDDWRSLPTLRPDPHDPQTGWLATLTGPPVDRIRQLRAATTMTTEVRLELARTALELDDFELVGEMVEQILHDDPWEWRAVWVQGLVAFAGGDAMTARVCFNSVYDEVPGELAPKLGLALSCERAGDAAVAERLYQMCARSDAAYVPMAAFGLARMCSARDDTDGAVAAYDMVPTSSSAYRVSRGGLVELLAHKARNLGDLDRALASLEQTSLPQQRASELRSECYSSSLQFADADKTLAGGSASEPALRTKLYRALREQARHTPTARDRVTLIDRANTVRPWSAW